MSDRMTTPNELRAIAEAATLAEELRPYAAKTIGSIRIDVREVAKIVEWLDRLAALEAERTSLLADLEAAEARVVAAHKLIAALNKCANIQPTTVLDATRDLWNALANPTPTPPANQEDQA